jgi:hypothetical protein
VKEKQMKKILPVIMIAALLMGCSGQAPTISSDAEMATRVAKLLTQMPTTVGGQTVTDVPVQTNTPVTEAPVVVTSTPEVVDTPALAQTPTEEPTATIEVVNETPTAGPTATNTPLPTPTVPDTDPRKSLGEPTFVDTMDNGDYWPTDNTDTYTNISFKNGAMHFKALTDTDGWRLMTYQPVTNFYIEVTGALSTCSGTDHFGLVLRFPEKAPANRGYLYSISCDGKFTFNEWDGSVKPKGTWTSHIYWKEDKAILQGEDAINRLGVMATAGQFTLFVNGVKVGEVADTTFSSGYFGVLIGSDNTKDLTVKIDELRYWSR